MIRLGMLLFQELFGCAINPGRESLKRLVKGNKMHRSVMGIYGLTCTGKSTLGTTLTDSSVGTYTSFGGLIRNEVAKATSLGKNIENALLLKQPIPLELGWQLLNDQLVGELNFVSGYPFTEQELGYMSREGVLLAGWILLTAQDAVIRRRYAESRAECPLCNRPGEIGSFCDVHAVPFESRVDPQGLKLDFEKRKRTMDTLVTPFLLSSHMQQLPKLVIDTTSIDREKAATKASHWLEQTFPSP